MLAAFLLLQRRRERGLGIRAACTGRGKGTLHSAAFLFVVTVAAVDA
ncbi:hypothetical protein ACPCBC_33280 [Streptomyces incarnatus]